jgi:hypothetical protein
VSATSKKRALSASAVQKTFVGFGEGDSIADEALTGHAGLSARGGVEEDALWQDDPMESEASKPVGDLESPSTPSEDEATEAFSAIEAEEERAPAEPSPLPEEEATPSSAPPVPESGLPEGWTEEQWVHYGHQWLAKQAED